LFLCGVLRIDFVFVLIFSFLVLVYFTSFICYPLFL